VVKTLGEMIREVWEALGEPTDLDPSTDGGFARLRGLLNDAQIALVNWKNPRSEQRFRWRGQIENISVSLGEPTTRTCALGSTESVLTLTLETTGLVNHLVSVGDEIRFVVAQEGNSIMLATALTSSPIGKEAKFYATYVLLDGVATIQRVTSFATTSVLEMENVKRYDLMTNPRLGTATAWSQLGKRLYIWPVPEAKEWFSLQRVRALTPMVGSTDVPDLPEAFHRGLVLWALAVGFERELEPEHQRELLVQLTTYMSTIQFPDDHLHEGSDPYFELGRN